MSIPSVLKARQKAKRNKYGARKTTYNGILYDSQREAKRAAELDLLTRAGEVKSVQRQPEFVFASGIKYRADFRIVWADGSETIEDVKGFETPVFRLKMRLLKHEYPEVYAVFEVVK